MEASLPEPHCFHDFLSSMESKQRRTISFGSLPRTFYDERANFYGVKHANLFEGEGRRVLDQYVHMGERLRV